MTRRTPLVALAAALVTLTVACGDDDMNDDPTDQSDPADTTPGGTPVPGQDPEPVNTEPADSQVTPTVAP